MKTEARVIETDSNGAFKYTALSDESSKRLLRVRSEKLDGQIQVDTWEASTTDQTSYRCLSYTWGDPEIAHTVLLNGRPIGVRSNLYNFLDMVVQRLNIDPLWLEAIWIDALCINQDDDAEKGTHVQRMGDIYEHAAEVLIWLGNSTAMVDLFEWLNKRQPIRDEVAIWVPLDRTPTGLREALTELREYPYWSRAWILQEVFLAKSLRLLCGTSETTPHALYRCIKGRDEWMIEYLLENRHPPYRAALYIVWHWAIKKLYKYKVPVRITAIRDIHHLLVGLDRKFRMRAEPFWEIFLDRGHSSECFDCRDHIYSLLSMTGHDASSSRPFEVDYGESTANTFRRAADHFLAWHQPHKVFTLWKTLELPLDHPQTVIDAFSNKSPIVIPMRSNRIFDEKSKVQCGSLAYSVHQDLASIEGYKEGDILLCTSANDDSEKCSDNVHALVRPTGAPGGDAFSISIQVPRYGWYPRLDDVELWYTQSRIETKLTSWTSVVDRSRAANPVEDHDWMNKPHGYFWLKTTLRYVEQLFDLAPWLESDDTDESRHTPPKFMTISQN